MQCCLKVHCKYNLQYLTFGNMLLYLAQKNFTDALGDGVWVDFINGRIHCSNVDSTAFLTQFKDTDFFHQQEEDVISLELPWEKVITLFNHARLFEELHDTEKASISYRLILFKVFLPFLANVQILKSNCEVLSLS